MNKFIYIYNKIYVPLVINILIDIVDELNSSDNKVFHIYNEYIDTYKVHTLFSCIYIIYH